MISLEQELKQYFADNTIEYTDNSSEFKLLDFTLLNFIKEEKNTTKNHRNFYLEVKEKRQNYNTKNWSIISSEEEVHKFIMDELSARKILAYAPFSGLVVRNNITIKYYWFSILDMFLMPKIRVNRPIQKNETISYKGKWIMDFRNGVECVSLEMVFKQIIHHLQNRITNYTNTNECYGTYVNEIIEGQGITRNANHWDIDVKETR